MHMKIYISPSREYYPPPTIPLAEMQPKYCIPASGGLLLFQFLSPLEEMHRKLCIPASGNAKRMLHLRFAEMQADVCKAVLHIKRSKKIVLVISCLKLCVFLLFHLQVSIETGNQVEWTSEKNYMFRLSEFGPQLLEWLDTNPGGKLSSSNENRFSIFGINSSGLVVEILK